MHFSVGSCGRRSDAGILATDVLGAELLEGGEWIPKPELLKGKENVSYLVSSSLFRAVIKCVTITICDENK